MKQTYIEHFVTCFLTPDRSEEESKVAIHQQLSVDIYKAGLERELVAAFKDPNFSWLAVFSKVWGDPDSSGLHTEEESRDYAKTYFQREVFDFKTSRD